MSRAAQEAHARNAIEGVGDANLGEWLEIGPTAVHIRRRLSSDEEQITGPAVDLRGTNEAKAMVIAAQGWIPSKLMLAFAAQEIR